MRTFIGLTTLLWLATSCHGQSCPNPQDGGDAAGPSTLHGTVVYHDELRHWLGFKLDQAACGQIELELMPSDQVGWRRAESLRQCTATVTGKMYYGETGYYSTEMAISAEAMNPDSSCKPFPLKLDPSSIQVPKNLRIYHASITVDVQGKGHSEIKAWRNEKPRLSLTPWDAYIKYFLRGSADAVRFGCREGFVMKNIRQTPKADIEADPDDPNWIWATLTGPVNKITFTCEKKNLTRVAIHKPS
jgi:hypothetical protein